MTERPRQLSRSRAAAPFALGPAALPAPAEPASIDTEIIAQAARRLTHRLNNDLALPMGTLELLSGENLPPRMHDLVRDAIAGLAAATSHVAEFQRLLSAPPAVEPQPPP